MKIEHFFDDLKTIGKKVYFSRNGEEELVFTNTRFQIEIYKTLDSEIDIVISADGVRENYLKTKALNNHQIEQIQTLLRAPLSMEMKCKNICQVLATLHE